MPLNFRLAGKSYPPHNVTIEAAAIEAYARATSDLNPRYLEGDDRPAPPLFAVVAAFPIMLQVTGDPELGVENPLKILHGAQAFRYHRRLRAGETVVLTPVLESVDDKGSGATFVVRIEAASRGEPVVDQWWTIFVRGAGSGTRREREARPEGPVRTGEVARFAQKIEDDMPTRYAEASGDHNPIHLDDQVAKAVGLPGVINHGLGTLALVSGGLVDHLMQGDPERLERLAARFTLPVRPGDEISTTVWAVERPGAFVYEVARPDERVAVVGELEAR
ncbi:MAG: MaoC/PaaZ C-terminal domain-containing protein [Acidimicrobiia bacterium]